MLVYAGLLYLTYYGFTIVPIGFIPDQDKGYLLVNVQLPDSASLERTQAVMKRMDEIARDETAGREPHRGHRRASRSSRTRTARISARCS